MATYSRWSYMYYVTILFRWTGCGTVNTKLEWFGVAGNFVLLFQLPFRISTVILRFQANYWYKGALYQPIFQDKRPGLDPPTRVRKYRAKQIYILAGYNSVLMFYYTQNFDHCSSAFANRLDIKVSRSEVLVGKLEYLKFQNLSALRCYKIFTFTFCCCECLNLFGSQECS